MPEVSVILPTYNRAAFLPGAFASIENQTGVDWEAVVVDDGSTDDTPAVAAAFAARYPGRVQVIRTPNRGAGAARATGLAAARGPLVAFLDSDDRWLPGHLARAAAVLAAEPDVDWVFGPAHRQEAATGRVLVENTFFAGGRPRAVLALRSEPRGPVRVLTDDRLFESALVHGQYTGIQAAVFRADVFRRVPWPPFRLGDDTVALLHLAAVGTRAAYFDTPTLVYQVHDGHLSNMGDAKPVAARLAAQRLMQAALDTAPDLPGLTARQRRQARRFRGRERFWALGYALLWAHGRRAEALAEFHRALPDCPFSLAMWKTYLLAVARHALSPAPAHPVAPTAAEPA